MLVFLLLASMICFVLSDSQDLGVAVIAEGNRHLHYSGENLGNKELPRLLEAEAQWTQ